MANALIDCCPVVAIGGSSPIFQFGRQVFQEIDQVAIMKGCVKWSDRVYNLKRIPEQVNNAFQHAMSGKPLAPFVKLAETSPKRCSFCGRRGRDLVRVSARGRQICAACATTASKIAAETPAM